MKLISCGAHGDVLVCISSIRGQAAAQGDLALTAFASEIWTW